MLRPFRDQRLSIGFEFRRRSVRVSKRATLGRALQRKCATKVAQIVPGSASRVPAGWYAAEV